MFLKKNIYFLLDKSNYWIRKYLDKNIKKFPKKYKYSIKTNTNKIKNKIVFVLSYTKILSHSFLNDNILVLIVHPSKLPNDKGFAPVQNQILRKKNKIFNCIIKATDKVDAGPIIFKSSFTLKGNELSEEIRFKQAESIFKLISKFLKEYPKIKFKKQRGKSSFNKKRNKKDSELDINKNIKSQFNLLRICDNEKYPAFFKYKNTKYILKIYKDS